MSDFKGLGVGAQDLLTTMLLVRLRLLVAAVFGCKEFCWQGGLRCSSCAFGFSSRWSGEECPKGFDERPV